MSTRNIVKNIRSAEVVNEKPKLPQPTDLDYGEIAINYASGHETLSLKNNAGNIVSLSVNSVEDVKVNEASVVANKTANITMNGDTIPVAGRTYDVITYPSPFNENKNVGKILVDKKLSEALKILETNISALVTEVLDNEETSAAAIRKLAESAGTVDGSGNIGYQQAAGTHYISDAGSVHNATVILDSNLNTLQDTINNLQSTIDSLQTTITNLQQSSIEWVDLGLPSKLKWAKCNVGAKTETDYGSYFMWGDIMNKTNSDCSWANYKYGDVSSTTLTKYNNSDNKTTLDPEDDAVTQIMGSNWRIPTKTNFQELLDNTRQEWIEDYKGSGVNGYKFTSTTNSNSIFIPASGYRYDSSFSYQGNIGFVWSCSLNTTDTGNAWYLECGSSYISANTNTNRYHGFVVRGVCTLPL